ncbi:unnamed protein product [Anisakis simplex]|uniref:SCP domain-containing protein n=1 Tax=Anisakis simplex TaxID=6269 RepID=A0A0M3K9D8_ANISI|nr:unnamed protein product [Anisakis simplex]
MSKATDYWWNEINEFGIIDKSYKFSVDMLDIGHWTQMAWGPTSKLGCGVSHCPRMTKGYRSTIYVVCHYSDRGNYKGELIYDFGNGCNRDLDCDAFRGSKCEPGTNLCIAPLAI